MLTLFMESPTSPAMAWHAMKILRTTTKYLKTNQTPVMVADQPLFSRAKKSNGNSLKHNLGVRLTSVNLHLKLQPTAPTASW